MNFEQINEQINAGWDYERRMWWSEGLNEKMYSLRNGQNHSM